MLREQVALLTEQVATLATTSSSQRSGLTANGQHRFRTDRAISTATEWDTVYNASVPTATEDEIPAAVSSVVNPDTW